MKKKAIEKIPYLGLPETKKDRKVKYIGVTAVREIAGEKHFFLEVYRNKKAARKVPIMRIVTTGKDFGTYTPEDGVWSRARVCSQYFSQLPWEDEHCNYNQRRERNALNSPDDLKELKNFFLGVHVWNDADWWEYVAKAQETIVDNEKHEQWHRKYERRQQALRDRMEHTPALPEQEILRWADRRFFKHPHYLYYKKKGRRATVCCSACGGVVEMAWKAGISYESIFESLIAEPVANCPGECPLCGATGMYKPQGRANAQYTEKAYVWKIDRYKETGIVARYILIKKQWVLDLLAGEKGPEMMGAHEDLDAVETARAYLYDGKSQTDFRKYDHVYGKDYWDDCNLSGLNHIATDAAPLYPGYEKELEGTPFQYSAIGLYAEAEGEVEVPLYLERYRKTPQIEMLVKLKLYGVVREMLCYRHGIVADETACRPETFLGIRKEKVNFFISKRGDPDTLRALKMEKRMGQAWTEAQVEALAEIRAELHQLEPVLKAMGLQKVLNLISYYAGCSYGTGCAQAEGKLRNAAQSYFDYMLMRAQLGYDLHNTVYQKPRNLMGAHNKMMLEIDKDKQDKRLQEVAIKYPLIRENYRKLRNQLMYSDDEYIIRPARSAEEIVMEGRLLHHCVGGDSYLTGHNSGESLILMLRHQEEPEMPYVTVELRAGRIVQWYGAHDKKPDKAKVQRWLDAYVARIQCSGRDGAGQAAEVLIPA